MAKKSFIDRGNPAMQFITAPREESPEKNVNEEANKKAAHEEARPAKSPEKKKKEKASQEERRAAKAVKTAMPAGSDFSADMTVQSPAAGENKPETVRHPVAPRRQGESKSKRVQLLVPPSLHMKISRKAAAMDMSFNEYVNQLLEKSCGE